MLRGIIWIARISSSETQVRNFAISQAGIEWSMNYASFASFIDEVGVEVNFVEANVGIQQSSQKLMSSPFPTDHFKPHCSKFLPYNRLLQIHEGVAPFPISRLDLFGK